VDGDGHPNEKFHYMLANPPFGVEWKPEKDFVTREHNEFGFNGRFGPGLPRINDGALLFLLHMISKMHDAPDDGGEGSRIGIVFNGSPLFTGDAGSGESNIRRWIIENDMLEAVIGLPDQLFYNTGISTYVWIVTNRKRKERVGKVQLINGADFAWKMKKSLGNKRKQIGDGTEGTPNHIEALAKLYADFKHDVRLTVGKIHTNVDAKRDQSKSLFVSKIFKNQDFGFLKITVERPLRLNFAVTDERIARLTKTKIFTGLAISRKRRDKAKIKEETLIGRAAQEAILEVLQGMKGGFGKGQLVKDRKVFQKQLDAAFKAADLTPDGKFKDALLSPGYLAEKDPTAEICYDKKGKPEPDPDLRVTEIVTLPPGIALPLPLDYEGKQNKGKVDVNPLLALVRNHCEAYLKAEVLPYRSDAWIDHTKIKVGYEIPFARHFYEHVAPRALDQIESDIQGMEKEIMRMLRLKEQRIAVIAQAITKGLNKAVTLRESGVAWIGKVPDHWEVMKLHHIVRMQSGESITSLEIEESGEYPVYGGNGLRGYSDSYTHDGYYALIGRQGAHCGNINYAEGKFWASEHAVVATPDRKIDVLWLGETLRAMNLNQYSESAAQPGLSVEVIGRLKLPFPPFEEQVEIAQFIQLEVGKIDDLFKVIRETTDLLSEYRKALISAAATGKLDGRNVTPSPVA